MCHDASIKYQVFPERAGRYKILSRFKRSQKGAEDKFPFQIIQELVNLHANWKVSFDLDPAALS